MILEDTDIYGIGVRVGVTHRFGELRIQNHRLRAGGEVVEVVVPVEVVEVVVRPESK